MKADTATRSPRRSSAAAAHASSCVEAKPTDEAPDASNTRSTRTMKTIFFFFKQKTAYEIPLCDWSSDVCSSDLPALLDLARAIRAGGTSSQALTEGCLSRIRERDRSINAFITVTADAALDAARTADAELAAGRDRGPLHGIPISIKDIFDVAGLPTTAASHVRRGHVARHDATVVARLREAGTVFVGKTNLHEFALGTTNEESAYGPVHHPLDPTRSPGGSSGGSAASVLAGMAVASIGTDTGGSIRIPAAACGLVGLKPVFRDVPTQGVVPLSTSLDHVGPLCATV